MGIEVPGRWIDAAAAGRSLGVAAITVRRWCVSGHMHSWRTRGFGTIKRYQLTSESLELLRKKFFSEHTKENIPNIPLDAA